MKPSLLAAAIIVVALSACGKKEAATDASMPDASVPVASSVETAAPAVVTVAPASEPAASVVVEASAVTAK